MKMKKLLTAVAVAASFTLVFSSCAQNANQAGSATEDGGGASTVTIAYSEGGTTLDPAEANDGTSDTLILAAYDQLVTYGTKVEGGKRVSDTSTIEPMLASGWEVDDSNTVYTFKLRDDVTFQSGKKLTADDVVKSFEHIANSASASFLYEMAGIKSVEKTGDLEITITLTASNHLFMQIIPMYSFSILDMDLVKENGGAEWLKQNSAGSGPYILDSWDPASEAKLHRNADYWGDAPDIEKVNLKFIGDASNRLQLIKKGSVDVALEIAPKDLENLDGVDGVVVDSRPSNKILYFAMNNQIAPFDNEKVRQAITMAIPYDKLLNDVLKGQASEMRSAVASSTPGWSDAGNSAEYNLERAKELLSEAGYPDGFEFDFTLGSGFPDWNDDAVLIQAELAKIGITMNIQNMARAQFFDALAEKNVQAYISRWTSFVNDPGYHLGLLLADSGTSNYNNYNNPRVNELWAQAATEADAELRNKLYGEMQEIINAESPWGYLYEYNIAVTHRDNLEGYTSYPDGLVRFSQLSKTE